MWPTGDRPSGAVVRGVLGQEAMMHLTPGEGGAPHSNRTNDTNG
jgi:hypothetical protein